jgi:hypothetical protein
MNRTTPPIGVDSDESGGDSDVSCSNSDESDSDESCSDSDESSGDSDGSSDSDDNSDGDIDENAAVLPRAKRGEGKRKIQQVNPYRLYYSAKARKTRKDVITGEEVQRFCHESQWGGRLDTLKLNKQQVLVEQPVGGFVYENVRSFQYTVKEMYCEFKKSEYGERQRNKNRGKDMSEKRFRELICPCLTSAKQRDTADQINTVINLRGR